MALRNGSEERSGRASSRTGSKGSVAGDDSGRHAEASRDGPKGESGPGIAGDGDSVTS